MTNDIGRRTDEHRREYGKLSGSKIVLQYICIIDPEYISEAEKYLSNVFDKYFSASEIYSGSIMQMY